MSSRPNTYSASPREPISAPRARSRSSLRRRPHRACAAAHMQRLSRRSSSRASRPRISVTNSALMGWRFSANNVPGMPDAHGFNFSGLSAEFRYLVIGRGPGSPVGLTLVAEPEWARIDDGGQPIADFNMTFRGDPRYRAHSESALCGDERLLHPGLCSVAWRVVGMVRRIRDIGRARLSLHAQTDHGRRNRIRRRL